MTRAEHNWTLTELPGKVDSVARRRIDGCLEASIRIGIAHNQDSLSTFGVSCYLKGIEDGAQVGRNMARRTEGEYEEER